jgi:DNA replication protein DnaC
MLNKFVACDKCKDGWFYKEGLATKCDCLIQYQKSQKLILALYKAGINDKELPSLEFCKGNEESLLKLKLFLLGLHDKFETNSHLYLYGKNGTQKTYTVKALIIEALQKGLKCKYVLMNDLLEQLTDIQVKEFPDEFYNCDLLVIDESFDIKKVLIYKSGYQLSFLTTFLKKRMELLQKNTIFVSNISIKDIDENKFTPDIKDMLTRMIYDKKGELLFSTKYSSLTDSDFKSMWD